MYETTYHRPSTVAEAAALFAKGSESKYLAGGHTLIPVMKQRLASPSDVIDLGRIKELVGIELSADALTIKAATTYFDILQSADAGKSIAADDFFQGLFTTALEDGEIITQVAFPIPAKAAYSKMRHPASRFALTGVFVVKTKSGDVRVAATGASQNGVMRVSAIETALKANWSAAALDNVKISEDGLLTDIHGSSAYRANLIKVMAQRAVTEAG